MLKMEGLKASYGEIEVLHGIDVEVSQGEIVAVIGANSSGKSTMLTCISRLMPITGGSMTFCGADISRMRPEEVVNLGLIQCPEGRQLFPKLTVRENLELGAFAREPGETRAARWNRSLRFSRGSRSGKTNRRAPLAAGRRRCWPLGGV